MMASNFGRRTLLTVTAASVAVPAMASSAVIGGTGGPLAMARLLAAAYADAGGANWTVAPSLGSGGGLRAVAAGRIGLALSIGGPGQAMAGALRTRVFARTPVVLAAHRHCSVGSVTPEQAARLLRGEMRYWPDGMQAHVVLRPAGEREWFVLRDGPAPLGSAVQGPPVRRGEILAPTSQENGRAIADIEGAFGLITIGQIFAENLDVRVLAIGDAFPSLDALRTGGWPLGVTIHVSHHADAPPEVMDFLAFLGTPRAAQLLSAHGYLPAGGIG